MHASTTLASNTSTESMTPHWYAEDVNARIRFASQDLDLGKSHNELYQELLRSVLPGVTVNALRKSVILNSKSLIEQDADYSLFAGRIFLSYIYEETLGWSLVNDGVEALKEFHVNGFRKYLEVGVGLGRISQHVVDQYDLDTLADYLDPSYDMQFQCLGLQTLYERYLLVDKSDAKKHRRIECPQYFWMRVAMGIHYKEANREKHVVELFNLYRSRLFCSSTPTLFNSATPRAQLSSCFLYWIDDDSHHITQRGVTDAAQLSKWAGGLGGSWTSVRSMGAHIQGTNGDSQGVIPFLKLHNDTLVAFNQGGKRKGSGCAYLETWHGDINFFLELRRNVGDERRRTHDMNTANWIPDLFMKRMIERGDWWLLSPSDCPELHNLYGKAFEKRYTELEEKAERGEIPGKKVKAVTLWRSMLNMIFETGHPWITFKDPCNVRSPQDHVGVIHSSNLCTEITLNTSHDEVAVCNLGSINIAEHVTVDGINHDKLRNTVRIAVRALDNVIDVNFYPIPETYNANSRHRPVGLGSMGWAEASFIMGMPYESQEFIEFNDIMQEAIAYYAYEASSDLAQEKGSYSTFEGSKWHRGILPLDTLDLLEEERGMKIDVPRTSTMDWDRLRGKIQSGMRNSNVLAIAPTATISNIIGTTPCTEPLYENLFVKSNLSGECTILNTHMARGLKQAGLWNEDMLNRLKQCNGELASFEDVPPLLRKLYKTAFGIEPDFVIEAAARRQKWTDQSQSVNLWFKGGGESDLSKMYRKAWSVGLKTTYYLRTRQASNIEKSTVEKHVADTAESLGTIEANSASNHVPGPSNACSLEARARGEECESCQ